MCRGDTGSSDTLACILYAESEAKARREVDLMPTFPLVLSSEETVAGTWREESAEEAEVPESLTHKGR